MLIPTKVLRDEASVDNKVKPEDQMSAGAIFRARLSIVTGIVKSLVLYLYQNNTDADVVKDKINAVINAFTASKDIHASDLNWIRDTYVPSLASMRCAIDPESPYVPVSSNSYIYWFTIVKDALDNTSVFNYIYDSESVHDKLNDNERALINSYIEAQKAYFKARNEFEEYFRKVISTALKELLLRHGTTLQQIAPKWYGHVSKSAGCFSTNSEESDE